MPSGAVVPDVIGTLEAVQMGVSDYQIIHFQVLVRVDEQKGKSAKVNVVTGILGGGLREQSSTDQGHSAELQFKVPIALPQKNQKND